jgi:hypothetical protein
MRENKLIKAFTLAIALAIVAIGFQSADGQTKKKKITYYSIKTGTTFRVRIENDLSSKSARIGDSFRTTTVDPVYSNGGVMLAPAGSTITGRVNAVKPATKNGNPGSIDVGFTSITLPNRRRAAINGMLTSLESGETKSDNEGTASVQKTKHRNLKFIGGGAAGGAVIGGIAGGGKGAAIGAGVGALGGFITKKLVKGDEAQVKSGTEFGVLLNRAISLPRYAPTTSTP